MSAKTPDKQDLDRELDSSSKRPFRRAIRSMSRARRRIRKNARIVMIVTFTWDAPEDEVHRESIAQAREIATRGEFISKLILRDPATKTSGAVYVFVDRAAAERWRDDIRRRRGSDVDARIFEVNEEASKLTRGI
jgi:hypothetical protein